MEKVINPVLSSPPVQNDEFEDESDDYLSKIIILSIIIDIYTKLQIFLGLKLSNILTLLQKLVT